MAWNLCFGLKSQDSAFLFSSPNVWIQPFGLVPRSGSPGGNLRVKNLRQSRGNAALEGHSWAYHVLQEKPSLALPNPFHFLSRSRSSRGEEIPIRPEPTRCPAASLMEGQCLGEGCWKNRTGPGRFHAHPTHFLPPSWATKGPREAGPFWFPAPLLLQPC